MSALPNEFPEPTMSPPSPIVSSSAQGHTSDPAIAASTPNDLAPGRDTTSPAPTSQDATPTPAPSALADPVLQILADALDDIEKTRVANENRLRQLTRTGVDSDGTERGFGLSMAVPAVVQASAIVDALVVLNGQAAIALKRQMRTHPLALWVKATPGVGEQQAARLLSAIGDPYWNTLDDRPRTVSELWAYCGLHVLPVYQASSVAHTSNVGGDQAPGDHRVDDAHGTPVSGAVASGGDTGHFLLGTHRADAGVAARRRKGQRANWSAVAKSRAYLIAEACKKGLRKPCLSDPERGYATHVEGCACFPLRRLYDERKQATAGRLHVAPCVRCGPAGKPAQPGSEWSRGHREADALRIVSKRVLRELWRAARDLHQGSAS